MSCLGSESTWCGFDMVCPAGMACDAAHGRCVFPAQLTACNGLEEGHTCTFSGDPSGLYQCQDGVCLLATRCGDGIVDEGEACDDGNTQNGDGCSADCLSDERCGNGIIDAVAGETCDDGADNANAPDAACRFNCQPRRCGDGIIDTGCGELCDDGNLITGDGCSGDCLSDESCGNGFVDDLAGEQCDDGNLRSHDGCSSGCTVEAPNGTQWQPTPIEPRASPAMAYDAARGKIVLFGGSGAVLFNDTWEYDGTHWVQLSPPTSPGARIGPAMAYDAAWGKIVMFGGAGVDLLNDTWVYRGPRST